MKPSKIVSYNGLWGELPPKETEKQEVIAPEIIENIWRQVMDESNNSDCDYQMNKQPEFIQLESNIFKIICKLNNYLKLILFYRMPVGNTHILNTVNLRQQLNAMV